MSPSNENTRQPIVTSSTRAERHSEREKLSTALLDGARTAAKDEHNYNSTRVRLAMRDTLQERSKGKLIAYDWQLDVAEALTLGLDCTVIAGTGAGKTIPFVLPLFAPGYKGSIPKNKRMIVIISPLNVLEVDQVCLFFGYIGPHE